MKLAKLPKAKSAPELALPADDVTALLLAGGQAEAEDVLLLATGLVPVVGQGLVFNWVKLVAPVKGLIGALPTGALDWFAADDDGFEPQFGTQEGEKPRLSLEAA